MVGMDASEVLDRLPEEAQEIVLALTVVRNRIESLDPDNRQDLFELMMAWSRSSDLEDKKSAWRAMLEVMTQPRVGIKPMPTDRSMSQGSKSWAVHVGRTVKDMREKAGLTQVQLSKKAGLPQSHISRIENAEYTATNLTLGKIAKALGVDIGKIDPCVE